MEEVVEKQEIAGMADANSTKKRLKRTTIFFERQDASLYR